MSSRHASRQKYSGLSKSFVLLLLIDQLMARTIHNSYFICRQHLKVALDLASKAQDNHLRALVLAQIASHYFHTAGDHAIEVLQTCEQLAAGLGAPPAKLSVGAPSSRDQNQAAPVVIGNAPLGLWVGERFLGSYVVAASHHSL